MIEDANMHTEDDDIFYKTKQAASFLGLSHITLAKWRCYKGKHPSQPPYYEPKPRMIRYKLSDLKEWKSKNCMQ